MDPTSRYLPTFIINTIFGSDFICSPLIPLLKINAALVCSSVPPPPVPFSLATNPLRASRAVVVVVAVIPSKKEAGSNSAKRSFAWKWMIPGYDSDRLADEAVWSSIVVLVVSLRRSFDNFGAAVLCWWRCLGGVSTIRSIVVLVTSLSIKEFRKSEAVSCSRVYVRMYSFTIWFCKSVMIVVSFERRYGEQLQWYAQTTLSEGFEIQK